MSATETYADGEPAVTDPLTVMDRVGADNESFDRTLSAADTDGDGVPDESVTAVYDELYRVAPEEAADVVHREDGKYQAVRMVVTVDSGGDGDVVRDQMEWIADDADGDGVSAIATGDVIVNQITADHLAETALLSLVVALLSVLLVLATAYRVTEGSASLGVVSTDDVDEARVAVHELAHATLHEPSLSEDERPRLELEAEVTAYVVARHYGLGASNSRFYLAAWADGNDEDVRERLDRIQSTASRLIDRLDDTLESHR